MAGDWMKIELELPDKPEVHYISGALNLTTDEVVGKLVRIWAWFDKHTRNGHAFGVTCVTLDKLVCHSGFGETMMFAGWLEQRDKTLVMPNFDRHTSESAKKRALSQKRKSRQRHAESVTETGPEKRREEVKEDAPADAAFWRVAVQTLTAAGIEEKQARSFLGKHYKANKVKLAEVVGYLATNPKIEPRAYIERAMVPAERKVAY